VVVLGDDGEGDEDDVEESEEEAKGKLSRDHINSQF